MTNLGRAVICAFMGAAVLAIQDNLRADSYPDSLFNEIQNRLNAIQTISYKLVSEDRQTDEYQKLLGYKQPDRAVIIKTVTIAIKGAKYCWNTECFVPYSGLREQNSKGAFNDGVLAILFTGSESEFVTAKKPEHVIDTPIATYNPLMEAFSFLDSGDWLEGLAPALTLDELRSPDKWKEAEKRIKTITDENFRSHPCIKVEFNSKSGDRDIVYFSKENNYFPICWQHYKPSYLVREVYIKEFSEFTLPTGKTISLPRLLEARNFDETYPGNVCTQTISNVTINHDVPDDDFEIDPSLANLLFDRDTNKTMVIPK
jgi:hypothetical protein